jgi:HEAT repeat protein
MCLECSTGVREIGSERAIDGLLKLVEDSDSDVRWSAAEALGKIGSEGD